MAPSAPTLGATLDRFDGALHREDPCEFGVELDQGPFWVECPSAREGRKVVELLTGF